MVGPGDTLYDIAAEATPADGDVAAMVERIQRLNALDSGMLVAGQELRIPTERLTHTDFASRLDPGWRAGEDEGRNLRGFRPSRHFLSADAGGQPKLTAFLRDRHPVPGIHVSVA